VRSYRGLTPLMAMVSFVGDRRGRPIEELDFDGIQRARATTLRRNLVTDRVTGAVDPSVGITYGTAPARDEHEIPLRIYRPRSLPDARTDVPVVMWFHGGGWVLGDVVGHDPLCTFLAAQVGCVVVSVDYRMAPEHPFPAPLDDSYAALQWVADDAVALGVDPARLAVGGDSAGGNLAAVCALRARDRGGPALALQVLVYPVTDHDMTTASYVERGGEDALMGRRSMQWFWDHYIPDPADRANPEASPLRAPDLSGLAPAVVVTAEYDPLRDEGLAYAQRLREAAVGVTAHHYEDMAHPFFSFVNVFQRSNEAVKRVAKRIRATVAPQPAR
jgi:acetyl esterase